MPKGCVRGLWNGANKTEFMKYRTKPFFSCEDLKGSIKYANGSRRTYEMYAEIGSPYSAMVLDRLVERVHELDF